MKRLYWKLRWWWRLRQEDKVVDYILREIERYNVVYIHRYREAAVAAVVRIEDVPDRLHSAPSHSRLKKHKYDI